MHARKSNNAHKAVDKRRLGGKSAAQAAFIFHDCHLRHIFHFTLFSPFLITDNAEKTAQRRARAHAITEICSRHRAAKLSFTNLQFIIPPDAIWMKQLNK